MTELINGRELLAIRARAGRARIGGHQSLRQTEADREVLLREVYQLREIAATNGTLYRSAEGDVSAVHALVARWQEGVSNLYAANGEEGNPETRKIRAARAAQIECCTHELREALSAPRSPAEPVSPASTPTETSGGAREAQEGLR